MINKIFIPLGIVALLAIAISAFSINNQADAAFLGSGLPITAAGNDITVAGSVTATSFIYTSDVRLKDNIVPLSGALAKVKSLQGISFSWKDSGQAEIGFIAQDVEKIVPELVVTGNDGLKAVKYGNIVALLVEAVKDQQAQIDSLEAELEALR